MGEHIKVWEQNWLKNGVSITTPLNLHNYDVETKVKDLIMDDVKAWNYVKISSMFDSNTVNAIMQTPLFDSVRDDTLVWKLEHDDMYLVCSAYDYCVQNAGINDRHGIPDSWNIIWRAKIPPKVKNFISRVGRNVLPTGIRLNSCRIKCPAHCVMCKDGEEDTMHILFRCSTSIQCWQRAGMWEKVNEGLLVSNNIAKKLFSVMNNLDTHQQEVFSVMAWSLWKRRNSQVWDNITENSQTLYERAMHLITSWRNAQQARNLSQVPHQAQHPTVWSKPSLGRYKCNIDASFSAHHNKVSEALWLQEQNG